MVEDAGKRTLEMTERTQAAIQRLGTLVDFRYKKREQKEVLIIYRIEYNINLERDSRFQVSI